MYICLLSDAKQMDWNARGAHWGILGGQGGGVCFVTTLLLKCICLVFHVENGQN